MLREGLFRRIFALKPALWPLYTLSPSLPHTGGMHMLSLFYLVSCVLASTGKHGWTEGFAAGGGASATPS